MNKFKQLSNDEFQREIHKTQDTFDSIEVTQRLYLTGRKDEVLHLKNCKFGHISIQGEFKELTLTNCNIETLSIWARIENTKINNINNPKAEIDIAKANISKLQIVSLSIKKLSIGTTGSTSIKFATIVLCKLDEFNFLAECKLLRFEHSNNIEKVYCHGTIETTKFNTPLHCLDFKSNNSFYQNISYSNKKEGGELSIEKITSTRIIFYGLPNNANINIKDIVCSELKISKNHSPSGRVTLSHCNNFERIMISETTLGTLNIFNTTLSNSLFASSQSLLNEINWQYVKWPNKANLYALASFENTSQLETLRLLKLNAKRQQDKFNTIKFSAFENEVFRTNNIHEKSFGDQLILILNKISNNHGMNPWRGVLFTIVTCALFFFPGLLFLNNPYWSWGWSNWSDFWVVAGKTTELYAKALYAAHSFDYLKDFKPKGIVFVLDLIGRIFVAYGYYQTIVAFRKFNRN
nr:hypothetical protein [uncultured Draconibacterium sp.]